MNKGMIILLGSAALLGYYFYTQSNKNNTTVSVAQMKAYILSHVTDNERNSVSSILNQMTAAEITDSYNFMRYAQSNTAVPNDLAARINIITGKYGIFG